MKNRLCDRLGIDFPIFAFTHCRDVAAAVTQAGGLGVLGTTRQSPDLLEIDLAWLDEHCGGRPYGVDLLFPANTAGEDEERLRATIPAEHQQFVAELSQQFRIGEPKDRARYSTSGDNLITTHRRGMEKWEVARSHQPALVASALGPVPREVEQDSHGWGAVVVGMVGALGQAPAHVAAGADVIVAQGTEAGGHGGRISTLVLVPQVVDEVPDTPVLAAGGIADGRQIAAAIALGAQGVWTGSLWLTTVESDLEEPVKRKLLEAGSKDAIQSRCLTGKPIRMLRTPWVDAWESGGAPPPLPAPLQGLLVRDTMTAIFDHEVEEVMGTAVGQAVGMMGKVTNVRTQMYELVDGFAGAAAAFLETVDADR
ncbi:MAG: nitronate monooxygenase [Micromonosporaceae bacterium]|nr:nitronate monooxygenase [Micromonosporaceae bacterium]